jgi:hypothetical protein
MKPEPAVKVPGKTPWERLDSAVRIVLSVSREAVIKEEAKLQRARQRRRAKKKVAA